MRAEIKNISSDDYPVTRTGLPFDPRSAWVIVEAEIGPKDGKGSDIFFFYVCTAAYLSEELESAGSRFGRHLLIMNEFNWDHVVSVIEKLVSSFEEPDWRSLAEKIARYAQWEFEDYQAEL